MFFHFLQRSAARFLLIFPALFLRVGGLVGFSPVSLLVSLSPTYGFCPLWFLFFGNFLQISDRDPRFLQRLVRSFHYRFLPVPLAQFVLKNTQTRGDFPFFLRNSILLVMPGL